MMNYRLCGVCAATALSLATQTTALEVTGGQVELGYSTFLDETEVNKTQLLGSVEFGFNRSVGVQVDLGTSNFGVLDDNSTLLTVHGIYHGSPDRSFGLFAGTEDLDGERADFIGIEGGFQIGANSSVEGYLSYGEDSVDDFVQFGVQSVSGISDGMTVSVLYDYVDLDIVSLSRFGIRGDYRIPDGLGFYGELGSFRGDTAFGGDSEAYVGIGLTYSFGAERGTSFNSRGLARVLPGF